MKKRGFKKRRYRRRGMTTNQMINYAVKGVRLLKGLVNVENHMYTQSVNTTISNAGSISSLGAIAAGNDTDNRQGNSILAKYWSWRFRLDMSASATKTTTRILVFVDKAGQGVVPAVSDVLVAANPSSPLNVDNTDRFVILYDKQYALSITGNQTVSSHSYRKLNFHMKFSGTAGANYDINQIFILLISNEPTNFPIIDGYSRIGFYDN